MRGKSDNYLDAAFPILSRESCQSAATGEFSGGTKKKILALCFVAVASAASVSNDIDVPVLSQVLDISPDGTYQHSFETGNGISAQASGALKTPETEAVQGTFQYTAPDGTPISVSYVADDNGYQPQGAHIPEIPAYITRALEWQRTHPEKEEPLRKL